MSNGDIRPETEAPLPVKAYSTQQDHREREKKSVAQANRNLPFVKTKAKQRLALGRLVSRPENNQVTGE